LTSAGLPEPRLAVIKGDELVVSNEALIDLMREVLDRDVPFRFRARGWSMTPFIRDGDVITVAPLRDIAPGTGEVVAFVHPQSSKLVVHRVTGRKGAARLIQGDNVPGLADGVIGRADILGRVERVQRNDRDVWLAWGQSDTS